MTDFTRRPLDAGCCEAINYKGVICPISMVVEVPWPPSKNTYWRAWRNRIIISRLGNEFKKSTATRIHETLTLTSTGQFQTAPGKITPFSHDGHVWRFADGIRIGVRFLLHPPTKAKRDISNFVPAAQDALQHIGIISDDEIIDFVEIVRHGSNARDGYVRMELAILPKREDSAERCLCRNDPAR